MYSIHVTGHGKSNTTCTCAYLQVSMNDVLLMTVLHSRYDLGKREGHRM